MEVEITKIQDTIKVQQHLLALAPELEKKKVFICTIKRKTNKRSKNANNYLWNLCEEIAKDPTVKATKVEIYQKAIRDVGVFEFLPIRNDALDRWIENWNTRGLGWFSEKTKDSKLKGYTNTINYYGSSVYNTKEMSRLVDYIVDEAKRLDIRTETPDQIAEMMSLWEKGER